LNGTGQAYAYKQNQCLGTSVSNGALTSGIIPSTIIAALVFDVADKRYNFATLSLENNNERHFQ
jgi:hypothetical protein